MRRTSLRNILLLLLALIVGAAAGLTIGWFAWPVSFTEAAPNRLRQDWKDEAVWLAAQAFSYDHDLEVAQARLRPLGTENLGQLVLDRAKLAIAQRLPPVQITHLARLAAALGARDPAIDPYLTP